MPSAVILSEDTYQRLMMMLEKWEKGQIVSLDSSMKNLETGTGYQKIGPQSTIDLTVCINGSAVTKKFMLAE